MKEELKEVLEYKAEVNSNLVLKKYGLKLVGSRNYKFFKLMGVMFLIVCVSFIGVLFYLGSDGKLSSTYENIINPMFNASVNVDNFNTYEFNPVNNNKFSQNYTIEINIPIDAPITNKNTDITTINSIRVNPFSAPFLLFKKLLFNFGILLVS